MSALKFIDISSHNDVSTAGMDGIDGVICKATQGTYYVNPLCDQQYQLAKSKGRLLGVYHYAGGGNPEQEAEFFFNNIRGYVKEAVPALDWEAGENNSWGDYNWCRRFVNRFHELTGVWCIIYVQASAIAQVANCADTCGLWVAGYPTDAANWDAPAFPYDISPWGAYVLWQFTSGGGLDRNYAGVDAKGWRMYANPGGAEAAKPNEPSVTPPSTAHKSLEQLASEVQAGVYGNGDARANALGKYFAGVQAIVNHRATGDGQSAINTLANETLKGVYGNGDARTQLLGTYAAAVQNRVNELV